MAVLLCITLAFGAQSAWLAAFLTALTDSQWNRKRATAGLLIVSAGTSSYLVLGLLDEDHDFLAGCGGRAGRYLEVGPQTQF